MHGPLFHTLACALPGSSLYCLMEASMDYDLKTLENRDQYPFSLYRQVCACYPAFQTLYCLKMHMCIYVVQRGKQKDSTEFRIMAISRGKYGVCEWEDTGNSQQGSHTWPFRSFTAELQGKLYIYIKPSSFSTRENPFFYLRAGYRHSYSSLKRILFLYRTIHTLLITIGVGKLFL